MKIALIPARGGSKRIKGKSIAEFCGRPIIAYSLDAARDSGLFDAIHVSTDSIEIKSVVEQLGFQVDFMRPDELADDRTPLVPVARWVLQEFARRGQTFEDLCLLLPCAPLIEPADLVSGYEVYRKCGRELPVHSVAVYPAPIEWAFDRDERGALTACQPGKFAVRSQDLKPKYFEAGMFSFFPAARLLDPSFSGGGPALSVELPSYRAVDIDEPDELIRAEILFLGLREYRRHHAEGAST